MLGVRSFIARRRTVRKERAELAFWQERLDAEGKLGAGHYHWFFTVHQDLDRSAYDGRRILDVGCGPRGSLEWADAAAERVGADPLADSYRELGTADQAMSYVAAGAEALPFADGHFDFVSCFNALDHVEDPDAALAEMVRVLAPGGSLLLIVEIGHAPTEAEPHTLGWDVLARVAPPLEVVAQRRYPRASDSVYDVLIHSESVPDDTPPPAAGFLSARLVKPR